jgi:hypothetical protein
MLLICILEVAGSNIVQDTDPPEEKFAVFSEKEPEWLPRELCRSEHRMQP